MESDIATVSPLARHIRELRLARAMTLAELEGTSGVSRASLSRIENGEVSPTAETLAKLSSAFSIPISQIISPLEQRIDALIPRADQTVFHDASTGFRRRNVSPPDPNLRLEIVEATLEPAAAISYDRPSVPDHEHHIVLLEGRLDIDIEGGSHTLFPGDCLRFHLNGPSAYRAGPDGARYLLALV